MIPAITAARLTGAGHRAELPLLVLGPSLGTSATTLWSACAAHLTDAFDVVAWDLPGHGHNRSVPEEPFTIAELAAGVLEVVDTLLEQRGETGGGFAYAGDSVGGAVGLQLLLDVPDRVESAVLLCTGARIGDQEMWSQRIGQVRGSGTSALVGASTQRWFGPGFLDREPERGSALLHALQEADDGGYCQVCGALADFDVRDRLAEIGTPVLAVAGTADVATPTDGLRAIAEGVKDGRLVELDGVAHLAPAEEPEVVARLIRHHVLDEEARPGTTYDAGLAVRREVLGDDHVDRAGAATTELTREFQELITTYAWGTIWTRPGLDRRSRSLITLTALVAGGHHEELALHLRAARTNGLSVDEIKELLLQTAIYCGVPAANTAFRIAQQVLAEEDS
ncbi:MAG TPA: 4-carboxymuconolactone decarboxylase [Nocardioides sp.]|nr:4-carboxymuconolactone decarboxylase [Nocardioides sp.]HET8962032.1 4-carboxymuconolactone decarboxylase [Nocardioides sp.]